MLFQRRLQEKKSGWRNRDLEIEGREQALEAFLFEHQVHGRAHERRIELSEEHAVDARWLIADDAPRILLYSNAELFSPSATAKSLMPPISPIAMALPLRSVGPLSSGRPMRTKLGVDMDMTVTMSMPCPAAP